MIGRAFQEIHGDISQGPLVKAPVEMEAAPLDDRAECMAGTASLALRAISKWNRLTVARFALQMLLNNATGTIDLFASRPQGGDGWWWWSCCSTSSRECSSTRDYC